MPTAAAVTLALFLPRAGEEPARIAREYDLTGVPGAVRDFPASSIARHLPGEADPSMWGLLERFEGGTLFLGPETDPRPVLEGLERLALERLRLRFPR